MCITLSHQQIMSVTNRSSWERGRGAQGFWEHFSAPKLPSVFLTNSNFFIMPMFKTGFTIFADTFLEKIS